MPGELELSVTSTRSRSGTQRVPEPVQDLVLVQGPQNGKPSASLQWKPPANLTAPQVSHYCVRISSGVSNQVLREIELNGITTRMEFPGDEYLEPLCQYIFAVLAIGYNNVRGDWSMLDGTIGMHYRVPT